MPTVLLTNGFQFFYANEGNEPCHIHVKKGDGQRKVWLLPETETDYLYGFTAKETKDILAIVDENRFNFLNAWNAFFER